MPLLIDICWPRSDLQTSYGLHNPFEKSPLGLLEVFTSINNEVEVTFTRRTPDAYMAPQVTPRRYLLRLVVITRSWKVDSTPARTAGFNISQEDLTAVITYQGLGSFFHQTRANVAGVYTHCLAPETDDHDRRTAYLGMIYDATLGLWARFDPTLDCWQGIHILPEMELNIEQATRDLLAFARHENFVYLLAARLAVEFLSVKSGDLPCRLAKIERRSGHHFSILQPIPGTYKELSNMTREATATANLVSYLRIVVDAVASDLLRLLDKSTEIHAGSMKPEFQVQLLNMRQRLRALSLYMSYLECRANRQIAATQHLVNETNASTNLTVAHDTHTIGLAARRDASSMKMLATMATTLLPGTLVAAIFSMDMFNWFAKGEDPVVSSRFWIYWSVTAPLTLLTVGLWAIWEWRLNVTRPEERQISNYAVDLELKTRASS